MLWIPKRVFGGTRWRCLQVRNRRRTKRPKRVHPFHWRPVPGGSSSTGPAVLAWPRTAGAAYPL